MRSKAGEPRGDAAEFDVVTGAFGFTGKYIAKRLLEAGRPVRTITGHPNRPDPFAGRVETAPFNFDLPDRLVEFLRGGRVLYNTYWIRFPYRGTTYEQAIGNTRTLLAAAGEAGIGRIVHISITNASEESPLPYFRSKGILEREIRESKLSFAIVRPTVIFGAEGILINNIAWLLRRFPVFLVPGSGRYRLQPASVEDVADIAVAAGQSDENVTVDAAGPEVFTFEELVRLIAATLSSRARIVHTSPRVALALSGLVGKWVGDVILTREELDGLLSDVLVSDRPPIGRRRLTDWLADNAASVGVTYASELARHYR